MAQALEIAKLIAITVSMIITVAIVLLEVFNHFIRRLPADKIQVEMALGWNRLTVGLAMVFLGLLFFIASEVIETGLLLAIVAEPFDQIAEVLEIVFLFVIGIGLLPFLRFQLSLLRFGYGS